ncbi:hypothetical protein U0070_007539 [Myodes glareolus]|uniref:Uncharacterized protein n=1 Tax=Myodes glareolus TaxID=447135 RepID=A0AAW0J1I5_MYOGA
MLSRKPLCSWAKIRRIVLSKLRSINGWNTWRPVWQMLGEQESALATEHVKVALKKYFQRPPSLPGREETQRVCLRDCHCGNQESLPFSSKAAREAEDAELQERLRMQSCKRG